jgi:hypothetical protein
VKDPEVAIILERIGDAVAQAIEADEPTVQLTTADARWLIANTVPPSEDEPPLTVPHGLLMRYPLSVITVVTALWEMYMEQAPLGQLKLTTPVEPLLRRLGKEYTQEKVQRQLDRALVDLYRLQKIGSQRFYKDGVDTLIVWLTPELQKRARDYQDSLSARA